MDPCRYRALSLGPQGGPGWVSSEPCQLHQVNVDVRTSKRVENFYTNLLEPKLATVLGSRISNAAENEFWLLLHLELGRNVRMITWQGESKAGIGSQER